MRTPSISRHGPQQWSCAPKKICWSDSLLCVYLPHTNTTVNISVPSYRAAWKGNKQNDPNEKTNTRKKGPNSSLICKKRDLSKIRRHVEVQNMVAKTSPPARGETRRGGLEGLILTSESGTLTPWASTGRWLTFALPYRDLRRRNPGPQACNEGSRVRGWQAPTMERLPTNVGRGSHS